jgi:murein DD-endopeptidase MepM/ murein hydrolase activator NlpD
VAGPGRGDDASARVRSGSNTKLNARVPLAAASGPLVARVTRQLYSKRSRPISVLPPPPPAPNPTLSPVPGLRQAGAPRLETGTSRTKVFAGARRAVIFSWRLSAPGSLKVELVGARDGTAIKTWSPAPAPAGQVQSVVWTGRLGGSSAPRGRYSFRLTAQSRSGAIARSSAAGDYERDAFDLFDHKFPIRGAHDYGGPAARYGAGRAGHTHAGHDTFARCGTKLVAARGGRVIYSGYQGAAGNYIVIQGAGSGFSYAYMHLREPSPFRKGDRVYTGQQIGMVGDTGDAQGCHLHFELWRGAWYGGGHTVDPLPYLRAWDTWS